MSGVISGFLFALTTGASFIESGRGKKVIVVGADKMSSIIDYTDRSTCMSGVMVAQMTASISMGSMPVLSRRFMTARAPM